MRAKWVFMAVLVFLVLSFYVVGHAEDIIEQNIEGGRGDFLEENLIDFEEDDMLPEEDMGIISGVISGIDVNAKTLTIKSDEAGTKTLIVDADVSMLWKGAMMVELSGLAAGDVVDASYITDDDGSLAIEWVEVVPEDMLPLE